MTSGPGADWQVFRRQNDLLDASHRGLQRCLIPLWMQDPKSLSDRIEASAYGETPPELIETIMAALRPAHDELFVDLGCGAGNVCAWALGLGIQVLGIERNPELLAAAKVFLSNPTPPKLELRCADFLKTDWSAAEIAYTTSARFPQSVLVSLASFVSQAPALRAIACLGRPLPLEKAWSLESLGRQSVVWNPGEATLSEPLFIYRRTLGTPSAPTDYGA